METCFSQRNSDAVRRPVAVAVTEADTRLTALLSNIEIPAQVARSGHYSQRSTALGVSAAKPSFVSASNVCHH